MVYVKGRRAGGTHGAVNRLVEIAFKSPQSRHLWVDTIHRNIGRYVRRYFMRGIAHTGASYNSQLHVLNFPNGSYCDFGSAERPENLEGFGYDYLWINEAGTVLRDESLYFNTLLPMAMENPRAQLFFIGSPKGKGLFYRMYQWGQDELKEDWASFHHTSFENTHLSRELLEGLREFMPERIYRQEILAEFIEEEGAVFRNVEEVAVAVPEAAPDPTAPYVIGVDLARRADYTVIWVGRSDTLVCVYCERFTRIPWNLQIERIAAISKRYGQGPIYADATGLGDPVCESMLEMGLPVHKIVFTSFKKQQLIERLALALERKKLSLVPHEQTLRELEAYEHRLLPSGHVLMEGGNGQNDDCVVALALCFWGMTSRGSGFILGSKMVTSELDGYN